MMRLLLATILLSLSVTINAQLSVSVDALPDSIYFGDEVDLHYKVNVPDGVVLNSLDFTILKEINNEAYMQDTVNLERIMDVDIVDGGSFGIDDANLVVSRGNGNQQIPKEGTVKIRISTIGIFFLPVPTLGHLSTQNILPLQRKPLFVLPRGQAVELNANKPIIEENVSWSDYLIYLYGLIAAAVLIFLGIFINKKLKKEESIVEYEQVVVKRPPHVIAIDHLDQLKAKQLWQNGEEKAYHTELTRIMRQYVEDRYETQALEMTTSQLKRALDEIGIDSMVTAKFVDILQIADKVKFAKGVTGPEINQRFMDEAYQIVRDTQHTVQNEIEE